MAAAETSVAKVATDTSSTTRATASSWAAAGTVDSRDSAAALEQPISLDR